MLCRLSLVSCIFLVVFSIVFTPQIAMAQQRLAGTVSDAVSGEPVAGVSVVITDLHSGTQTNDSGFFSFQGGIRGTHLLEFSHIQFTSRIVQVDFSRGGIIDVILQPTVVENAAVVVTGVAKASDSKKVPFQVSLIRAEDIRRTPALNVVDFLSKVPGVTSLQSGPAVQKPVIRGLGYNRVLVINDGVRQEGQQWGDEHGLEIADEGVEKIEVLKGPASLIYGSDAMAGVVNIISDADISRNAIKGRLSADVQSNNRARALKGNLAMNRSGFVLQAGGAIRSAADYRNARDRDVFNSKFRQQSANVMAGLHRRWGFTHLRFSHFNLLTGMVEGNRDAAGNFIKESIGGEEVASAEDFLKTIPDVPYQQITHRKVSADNNFNFSKKRLYVNVGLQENRRKEYGEFRLKQPTLDFRLRTLTWVVRLHLLEKQKWELAVGTNGMNQRNSNLASEQLIPEFRLIDGGLFSYLHLTSGKATFSGGLRYDTRNISVEEFEGGSGILNSAYTRSFNNFSASAGVSVLSGKNFTFKANVSRAFRAPAISELSSDGAHEGTSRYEYGSRELSNETSWQLDAGFEFASPHLALGVSGFYNYFDNYIFYRKLSSMSGTDSTVLQEGEALTAFSFTQRKAFLTGVEVSFDLHPHPLDWLHLESNFALVSGHFFEQLDGSRNLPMMPAPKWATEVRAEAKKMGSLKSTYLKLECEHHFKQSHPFTGFNTETNTNAYTIFNLGLGANIVNKDVNLFSFHFGIRNIFNTVYQSHLSRLKYAPVNYANGYRGIWAMGRNVTLSVQVPISGSL